MIATIKPYFLPFFVDGVPSGASPPFRFVGAGAVFTAAAFGADLALAFSPGVAFGGAAFGFGFSSFVTSLRPELLESVGQTTTMSGCR